MMIHFKKAVLVISLLIGCLLTMGLLSGCGADASADANTDMNTETQYLIYAGLNDATAGTPVLSLEEAKKAIRDIITDKGCGYTEYVTYGAYTDEEKVVGNDTLVYMLVFVDKEDVSEIAKTIKKELNLASVLIEESSASFEFAE